MADNMRIWSAVEKTNPEYTKSVSQRGGFTAIGANYQIKSATEQFGPIGVGWGYEVVKFDRMEGLVVAHVVMWHGDRSNTFGPIPGCAEMFGKRSDTDAPKKAMTDAITKGLSQLGFNADVFLGMFDDNKYVEEVKEHFRPKVPQEVMDAVNGAATLDSLVKVWTANKEWQSDADFLAAKDRRKKELQPEQKDAA